MNLNMKEFNGRQWDGFGKGNQMRKKREQDKRTTEQLTTYKFAIFWRSVAGISYLFASISFSFVSLRSVLFATLILCSLFINFHLHWRKRGGEDNQTVNWCWYFRIPDTRSPSLAGTSGCERARIRLCITHSMHWRRQSSVAIAPLVSPTPVLSFYCELRVRAHANLEFKLTAKCFLEYCRWQCSKEPRSKG